MNCRYCGSSNAASDHRCHCCGRRLHLAAARPAPEVYPVNGSLAPDSRIAPAPYPPGETSEQIPEPPTQRKAPYQPALFSTRDLGRVVPIEAYQQRAAERRERAREAESVAARQPVRAASLQGNLPFNTPASAAVTGGQRAAQLSETRFSKAPVAIPVHRVIAAAIDFGMVVVAAGAICVALALGAREGLLPGQPLYWFGGLAIALAALYKFFWAALDVDSPGIRWSQLKLLHFDGRTPLRAERIERIVWSFISILAGGLGLLWSLVDEESLTWHDHSSKTFLTPHAEAPKSHRS